MITSEAKRAVLSVEMDAEATGRATSPNASDTDRQLVGSDALETDASSHARDSAESDDASDASCGEVNRARDVCEDKVLYVNIALVCSSICDIINLVL